MSLRILLLFALISGGAMAQIDFETNFFHASLPRLGVTVWVQTLRNMETGALVSGSLEARTSGVEVNKLEIRTTDGTTMFDFGNAISKRHARVDVGLEDELRLAALALLLEDPMRFQVVTPGQEAILERAEISVSLGVLPFTDISLPGTNSFRVSGSAAVTAVRAPSGGALLITCSIRSNDRQFFSPGVTLFAAGPFSETTPLVRADDIGFGTSGSEKNFSIYAAVHQTDAAGRAALDGLFAAPESYSLGIDVRNGRSPVTIGLAATERYDFRARLTPILTRGVPDGEGEALERISAYVIRDSRGYPAAAHLTFESHLRFPATRQLLESGLEYPTDLAPIEWTTDSAFSSIKTLEPISAQLAHCNLSSGLMIQNLLDRPGAFRSFVKTMSKNPVPGEYSLRLHGVLERNE